MWKKCTRLPVRGDTVKIEDSLSSIRKIVEDTRARKYSAAVFEDNMTALIEAVVVIYQNMVPQLNEEADKFRAIYSFSDIDSFAEELTGWMLMFHGRLDKEFDDYRNKQKIMEAVGYIKENYSTDLNMAVVSNYISMNYSLFSYAFKQYTGSKTPFR